MRDGIKCIAVRQRQSGDESAPDHDRSQWLRRIVRQPCLGHGTDVIREVPRHRLRAVEVAAAAFDEQAHRPCGMLRALTQHRFVKGKVLPASADVLLVLKPLLRGAHGDEHGRLAVFAERERHGVLDADARNAALRRGIEQMIHHAQMHRLAHRQPRHARHLVVAGGLREAVEQLLEEGDVPGRVIERADAHEPRRAPHDAEIARRAGLADGRMRHEAVLGHVFAEDEQSAQSLAFFRYPQVRRRPHYIVRRILQRAALHELKHLVLRRAHQWLRRSEQAQRTQQQ